MITEIFYNTTDPVMYENTVPVNIDIEANEVLLRTKGKISSLAISLKDVYKLVYYTKELFLEK